MKDVSLSGFASVFMGGNFYIIGGSAEWEGQDTIARLSTKTWSWSEAGRLTAARTEHGAIWINSTLVVVGGRGTYMGQSSRPTEFCELKNGKVTCVEQNAPLQD